AITKLNGLVEKAFAAYDDYEFHVISHAVNDFCVVELSSFYLDIIKDRLYCEETDGLSRRSAQTALYLILDTITKLFAPILAFTCDEIWLAMPHREGDDVRNVVLNDMNQPFTEYALSADQMAKWDRIIAVRTAVNGALEAARNEKKIGKSLEAKVAVTVPAEDAFLAELDAAYVADLFIVSQVEVTVGTELAVSVSPAEGEKCERCWKKHPLVGSHAVHTTLCPRCAGVVPAIDIE
ncbi:MAG: class I tRNA ligase family protein, partial [Clostridia bacterium]|nr:class I tRNA ligase family protein [Clostridia bacterium]